MNDEDRLFKMINGLFESLLHLEARVVLLEKELSEGNALNDAYNKDASDFVEGQEE